MLLIHDVCDANNMLKEIKDLLLVIMFCKPDENISKKYFSRFTDAAFKLSIQSEHRQAGALSGI